jgi:hypothetical protein
MGSTMGAELTTIWEYLLREKLTAATYAFAAGSWVTLAARKT